jgi:hypothetical protein
MKYEKRMLCLALLYIHEYILHFVIELWTKGQKGNFTFALV